MFDTQASYSALGNHQQFLTPNLDVVAQAINGAQNYLQTFASSPDLIPKSEVAFGTEFDRGVANSLFQDLAIGNFDALPPVEILPEDVLPDANGAFAASTGTVYLDAGFIAKNAENIDALTGVVLEEYGHAIDPRINVADSPGDEGEIFAAIAQGKPLSNEELLTLKNENDNAVIDLDGEKVSIEKNVSISGRVLSADQPSTNFDGDGDSDILWRNLNSGETHIWKINAATMTRQTSAVLDVVPPSSGWNVAGTGDFDGDGDSDILWRNLNSGETHIWKINAATMTRQTSAVLDVVPPSSGWSVAGTGDFDGDGDSDILWRNLNSGETHIWKINAATMTRQTSAVLDVVPPSSGWSVAGTGDFDGDGDSDILWRNLNSGETHIWKINAATMTRQTSAVLGVVPPSSGWSVAGTGDFDGDGDSDILWRNLNSGETHIWKINAATMTRQTSAVLDVVPPSSGWSVAGTGDFDGDGDSDILWRNLNSGETHIWKINAATMTRQTSAVLDVVPPSSGWNVAGTGYGAIPSLQPNAIMTLQQFENNRGGWSWYNAPTNPFVSSYTDNGKYHYGNCTWYAYGRMLQLGFRKAALDTMRGNAGTWDNTAGNGAYSSSSPQVGSIAVWDAGRSGAGGAGHVAVVERVNSDGTILISESNWDVNNDKVYNEIYVTRTIPSNAPSKFVIVPKA